MADVENIMIPNPTTGAAVLPSALTRLAVSPWADAVMTPDAGATRPAAATDNYSTDVPSSDGRGDSSIAVANHDVTTRTTGSFVAALAKQGAPPRGEPR